MSTYRTHTLDKIEESVIGSRVTLSGWVASIRDHGGILFLDLRDHYGMVQVVLKDETMLEGVCRETVIMVEGEVIKRAEADYNEKLKSGKVELKAEKVTILGKSKNILPFEIADSKSVNEDTRLKYRYLDLRNPLMQQTLKLRSDLTYDLRTWMRELDFTEVQTPLLSSSSPEGARDFLVPSRLHKGCFYALPQAPQQFKQLLMVAGMDKYFQIAPCFRDEDARADRSPGEFYQLDMEMSFATQEDVFEVMENILYKAFSKYGKFPISKPPFARIPYKESMLKYGTDKPDLRNPIIIKDLTKVFEKTEFGAFSGKTVHGFAISCAEKSRKFYDGLQDYILSQGAKGLAWVAYQADGTLKGPIIKFISEQEQADLIKETGAKIGDDIFLIADEEKMCNKLCGLFRTEIAKQLDIIKKDSYEFCWIIDFPMYELHEETGKIDFCHNPFSMPQGGLSALTEKQPLDILAYQYDVVVNGIELSSGAVRNHDLDIMVKAFEIAGYDEETIKQKFSALYEAFKYGAPPHAGIAPGLDRMLMLLLDVPSIREVVAFPLNSKAEDPMMKAPSAVTEQQLREVHIKIR